MDVCLVYITTADDAEAQRLAAALVDERLAACANILPDMTPLFRWEGEVRSDSEAVLLLKTRRDLIAEVSERVRALHSYECPCVVALPIVGGNPDFLAWIESETREARER